MGSPAEGTEPAIAVRAVFDRLVAGGASIRPPGEAVDGRGDVRTAGGRVGLPVATSRAADRSGRDGAVHDLGAIRLDRPAGLDTRRASGSVLVPMNNVD